MEDLSFTQDAAMGEPSLGPGYGATDHIDAISDGLRGEAVRSRAAGVGRRLAEETSTAGSGALSFLVSELGSLRLRGSDAIQALGVRPGQLGEMLLYAQWTLVGDRGRSEKLWVHYGSMLLARFGEDGIELIAARDQDGFLKELGAMTSRTATMASAVAGAPRAGMRF